jgi:hypothetical protein
MNYVWHDALKIAVYSEFFTYNEASSLCPAREFICRSSVKVFSSTQRPTYREGESQGVTCVGRLRNFPIQSED